MNIIAFCYTYIFSLKKLNNGYFILVYTDPKAPFPKKKKKIN